MYGRHFECMYTGSMIGAGAIAFAIMGYVIATRRGEFVELNPKLLAFTLGESEEDVKEGIRFLCAPDKHSRSKAEEGRRLVFTDSGFTYRVVNAKHYDAIQRAVERLDADRIRKAKARKTETAASSSDVISRH